MTSRILARSVAALLAATPLCATAQVALHTVAPFSRPLAATVPFIRQAAQPSKPLTTTGARGAILGDQSGVIELWQLPVKVFSGMHLRAEIDGYTVPLELNPGAAEVQVQPGHTILTYSFAGITVRQHMLVSPATPNKTIEDPGALLYFEIDAVRPVTLTVTLTPAMQQMWPAPQYGIPGSGWVPMSPDGATGSGGAYTVATDNPALFGMIGMPNSKPGHLPVYQEHPQTLPLEFLVRYDPAKDKGRLFPLLSTVSQPGEANNAASNKAMQQRLADQADHLPQLAQAIDEYYAHFFDTRLTVHTPDPKFDEALRWAELSIDDSQVEHLTGSGANRKSETGLVAGWFPSYDSTRPGFGWYFGRDTLWSLYAIDSYGDTALSKRALEFLLHRQRADGKMMHEFSQMADDLPENMRWSTFGYEYAAADATPLFLLALRDYVRTSGDTAFLAEHWDQAKLAWHFERTHDSDGDGVYDNSQGTGWVENWQSPMPHQELYLASLDQQAAEAMADLARLQKDKAIEADASGNAWAIAAVVESYRGPDGTYAFSKNADGSFDRSLTVYPSVALWNPPQAVDPRKASGQPCPNAPTSAVNFDTCTRFGLLYPDKMLAAWSSPLLATDWGTRALATTVPFYDPISYHMGSVWPLFTGWNAMAQYRTNHPAAAWLTLQQNLRLTFAEDPGTVTEVLSGAFFQPMGRSSAHQLWSSAMTLAPAIRGLFGIDVDSESHTLHVDPHLPVTWDHAELENVRQGKLLYDVKIERYGANLRIYNRLAGAGTSRFTREQSGETPLGLTIIALPAVEFGLHTPAAPLPGDETHLPHITAEHYLPDHTEFDIEAQANTTVLLDVRRNGNLDPAPMSITMPAGTGYVTRHISIPAH